MGGGRRNEGREGGGGVDLQTNSCAMKLQPLGRWSRYTKKGKIRHVNMYDDRAGFMPTCRKAGDRGGGLFGLGFFARLVCVFGMLVLYLVMKY